MQKFPKPNCLGKDSKINLKFKKDKLIADCDRIISLIVRKRDGYICQRCGDKKKQKDHAHFIGRTKWFIRWDAGNGLTLCRDCHQYLDNVNRPEFTDLMIDKFGQIHVNKLHLKKFNQIKLNHVSLIEIKAGLEKELKEL